MVRMTISTFPALRISSPLVLRVFAIKPNHANQCISSTIPRCLEYDIPLPMFRDTGRRIQPNISSIYLMAEVSRWCRCQNLTLCVSNIWVNVLNNKASLFGLLFSIVAKAQRVSFVPFPNELEVGESAAIWLQERYIYCCKLLALKYQLSVYSLTAKMEVSQWSLV